MKALNLNASEGMIVPFIDVLVMYLRNSICLTKKNGWQYFMDYSRISSFVANHSPYKCFFFN